jgi:lysophospholipase L1-like esterase
MDANVYQMFHRQLCNELFARPEYFDMTDCFQDVKQDIYIDDGHVNRYGNYLIADRISDVIQNKLLDIKA